MTKLVQESLADGTISPAHAKAYRDYEMFAGAGRFCFLIVVLVPAATTVRCWRFTQNRKAMHAARCPRNTAPESKQTVTAGRRTTRLGLRLPCRLGTGGASTFGASAMF